MLLRQNADRLDQFKEAITQKTKKHALTTNTTWKQGFVIQLAIGNKILIPYPTPVVTQLTRCTSTETITIISHGIDGVDIWVGYNLLEKKEHIDLFVKNEGYRRLDTLLHDYIGENNRFDGLVVHWTEFRYDTLFSNNNNNKQQAHGKAV